MSDDFQKVGSFHRRFNLEAYSPDRPPHEVSDELVRFRLRFLMEELQELADAYGFDLRFTLEGHARRQYLPDVADALIDLSYVALGTAHLHNLPWDDLFDEVQRANMSKQRAQRASDSTRGSTFDVVKPADWKPPQIESILRVKGWPAR